MNAQMLNRQSSTTMAFKLPKMAEKQDAINIASPHPVKRARFAWFASAALAVGVVGGVAFLRTRSVPDLPETPSRETIRRVTVITPEREGRRDLVLPATLKAYQATDLFARANGFLKAWHFDIGAAVKAGQLLAEIETPELDQELLQATAALKQAETEEKQAITELEEAKADVAFAQANVTRAKAAMDFAVSVERRSESLMKSRAVAPQEYEADLHQRDTKIAEWDSAKAELTRRTTNLATRKAIIDSRTATIQSRKASVQRLRDLTGFQKIFAPFDGIVTRRNAEVGTLVTAGTTSGAPLFSVAQVDLLRVHAAVPQSSALNIRDGDVAQILVPERPGQAFDAKVTRTAGVVDPVSRSLLVEVELPNAQAKLLPGSYAQVRFQSLTNSASLVVPTKVLLMRSSGPHVAIVGAGNSVETRKVTLGRDTGASVEVLIGLSGDERLVLNPADDLREGERVELGRPDERMTRR